MYECFWDYVCDYIDDDDLVVVNIILNCCIIVWVIVEIEISIKGYMNFSDLVW